MSQIQSEIPAEDREKEYKDQRYQVLASLKLPGKTLGQIRKAVRSIPSDRLFRFIVDMEEKRLIQVIGWSEGCSLWTLTESGRILLVEYERS